MAFVPRKKMIGKNGIFCVKFTRSQSFALSAATFFTFLKLIDASVAASLVALFFAAAVAALAAVHAKNGRTLGDFKAAAVPLSISCAGAAALVIAFLADEISRLYGGYPLWIFFVGAAALTLFVALMPSGALGRSAEILFAPALLAAIFSLFGEGSATIPKTDAFKGVYAAAFAGSFALLALNGASDDDDGADQTPKKRLSMRALPVIVGAAGAAAIYIILLFFGAVSGVFSVLMQWDVFVLCAASLVSVPLDTVLSFDGSKRVLFAAVFVLAFVFVAVFGENFGGAAIYTALSAAAGVGICVFLLTENRKKS